MTHNHTLFLKAPLSGYALPITEVPDPVFSQKMVGDGLSIDPTSECLLAPCPGEIIQLHSAGHAVTLKTAEGIEILIHIGLETVSLNGKGFTPKVKIGALVKTGDPLINFDADFLATHTKSLLSEIVITNSEKIASFKPYYGKIRATQDTILELILKSPPVNAQTTESSVLTASKEVVVPNPAGLHARPAAVLANLAKKFDSQIFLYKGLHQANAKSIIAMMKLEIAKDDTVRIEAIGFDAEQAIDSLVSAILQGLGDNLTQATGSTSSDTLNIQEHDQNPAILKGVAASPGIAIGQIYQLHHEQLVVKEEGLGSYSERLALNDAIEHSKLELQALQERLNKELDSRKASIFSAHQEILEDPELLSIAFKLIKEEKSAAYAWQYAYTTYAKQLSSLKNELLAARANDLNDVGERVLRFLTKTEKKNLTNIPDEIILIAENLTPSDTANLDKSKVVGFCTIQGGASSHVAILARSLGIPSIAGISTQALNLPNGTKVFIDGNKGLLHINPSEIKTEEIQKLQQEQTKQSKIDLELSKLTAITTDGMHIEVVANIGILADAVQAMQMGAEGVGLLRSEFLFLGRTQAPSEDEQAAVYGHIGKALGTYPLIIRTLDVGGDKPLPYLPIPKEDNPFLGERGIRVGINHPDVLRTQIRAILRAAKTGVKISIMFPMIATLCELRFAKKI